LSHELEPKTVLKNENRDFETCAFRVLIMEDSSAVKAHYFDASALVKLAANDPDEEPGRNNIRSYYQSEANFFATSQCLSEAIGVFKRKQLNGLFSQEEYIKTIKNFIGITVGGKLQIEEVPLLSPIWLKEAEKLMNKHGLDFVDCCQIVTLLRGKYSPFALDSKSILITADKDLAKAARAEGARVWLCTKEPPP
jgi:predicted nucleic acid-binding protein